MRRTLIIIFLALAVTGFSQDKYSKKFAKSITTKDLKERLSVLAADSLEGRATGQPGQKKAAKYIAGKFQEFGLEAPVNGSYFQKFDLEESYWNEVYLSMDSNRIENVADFLYFSSSETRGEEIIDAVYLADTTNLPDLTDKFIIFSIVDRSENWQKRSQYYLEKGAAGSIVVNKASAEVEMILSRFGPYMTRKQTQVKSDEENGNKIILIAADKFQNFTGKEIDNLKSGDSFEMIINADKHIRPVTTENVLGYLKGSKKPEELIIITSHYDHLGKVDGEIFNGADDDGSGTTSVMEIAQAFSEAAKNGNGPERSILFMCVAGEEIGLLGSEYYTNNPVFPLENTVTNLNIDMVGRVDDKYTDNPDYVYVIGSDKLSQDLHELSEEINKNTLNLTFDYTYNDENDPNRYYYRSDHYNFAKNNIPIIFYFNGTHPDYHQSTDTIEKINFDVMRKRAQLVFYTAWEIANRDKRVELD